MAIVDIVIVGLDVTDAAVVVLKLTLNDKIGMIWPRQIKVIVAGGIVIKGDLEVLAAGPSDRNVIGVESQWMRPCFNAQTFNPISTLIARRRDRMMRM
jgi:hypothetical protein